MQNDNEKNVQPPTCNTGAVNTQNKEVEGLRALIDWASFTIHHDLKIEQVCDILGIDFNRFTYAEHGDKGYMEQLRFGGIQILFNGKSNMGIHVNITGQGCREFEQATNKDWSMFFALLQNFKVKFTRLDIAIDDFQGYLNINKMKRYLRRGQVKSKFRTAREMRKTFIADGSSKGDTIYFGSPQSRIQVRFYDKLLERMEEGKQIEEGIHHWIRSEIQLRDERADSAAMLIANESYKIGDLAKGILNNYISFVIANKDTNKSRWKVAKFWIDFLDNAEKLSLSQKAPDKTIERAYNWIDKQVTTTMAMLYIAFEHDPNFIEEVLNDGYSKLKKEHVDIINRYKMQFKHKYAKGRLQNFEEFKKEREQYFDRIDKLKSKKAQTVGENDSSL